MNSESKVPSSEAQTGQEVPEDSPERKSESNLDELAERLRSAQDADDDIAQWLAVNWQKMLGGLVVVLLVVYLVGMWRETEARKLGEAAQSFSKTQETFSLLLAPSSVPIEPSAEKPESAGEKKEESQTEADELQVFDANLTLLRTSYGSSIYARLSPLYDAARKISAADYAAARESLEQLGVGHFRGTDAPPRAKELDEQVLVSELAALLYARLLIAEGKSEYAAVNQFLTNLSKGASFVNVEAVVVLYRFSETPERRAQVLSTARELVALRPELGGALKVALGNLGASLEE